MSPVEQEQLASSAEIAARGTAAPRPERTVTAGDVRDLAGETVMGMRVAAYMWEKPTGFDQPATIECFATHWSTPVAHEKAERLFRESDVRRLLAASPSPVVGGEEEPPWRVMTPEEYGRLKLIGRHVVQKYYDGFSSVAVWLLPPAPPLAAEHSPPEPDSRPRGPDAHYTEPRVGDRVTHRQWGAHGNVAEVRDGIVRIINGWSGWEKIGDLYLAEVPTPQPDASQP